jgi:hypothetical protein
MAKANNIPACHLLGLSGLKARIGGPLSQRFTAKHYELIQKEVCQPINSVIGTTEPRLSGTAGLIVEALERDLGLVKPRRRVRPT